MQKFWKSVKIWQSYREFQSGPFFLRHSVDGIWWQTVDWYAFAGKCSGDLDLCSMTQVWEVFPRILVQIPSVVTSHGVEKFLWLSSLCDLDPRSHDLEKLISSRSECGKYLCVFVQIPSVLQELLGSLYFHGHCCLTLTTDDPMTFNTSSVTTFLYLACGKGIKT